MAYVWSHMGQTKVVGTFNCAWSVVIDLYLKLFHIIFKKSVSLNSISNVWMSGYDIQYIPCLKRRELAKYWPKQLYSRTIIKRRLLFEDCNNTTVREILSRISHFDQTTLIREWAPCISQAVVSISSMPRLHKYSTRLSVPPWKQVDSTRVYRIKPRE